MEIRSERLIIRPLKMEDVRAMRGWGKHDNPLLADYNFPNMTDGQIKRWYEIKAKSFLNRYFGILTKKGRLIGYMGIKNIKFLRKESTLGIVFDPDFMNRGYGSETLRAFLKYYFYEMNMKKMYLEVAEFNTRAQRVYKKMGFVEAGYYLEEFYNSNLDLENSYFKESKSCFVISDDKIYNYVYKMELTRDNFQRD